MRFFRRLVRSASGGVAFGHLTCLLFFACSLSGKRVRFGQAVRVNVSYAHQCHSHPTAPRVDRAIRSFLHLDCLRNEDLKEESVMGGRLVLCQLLVVVVRLVRRATGLTYLRSITSYVVGRASVTNAVGRAVRVVHPGAILVFMYQRARSAAGVVEGG